MKYKKVLIGIMISVCFLNGCQAVMSKEEKSAKRLEQQEEKAYKECEKIADEYHDIVQKAQKKGTLNSLETQKEIVKRLGKKGYAAVDHDNQTDMVNAEKVKEFCKDAKENKRTQVKILLVMDNGGFVQYHLEAEEGKITVCRSSCFINSTQDAPEISDKTNSGKKDGSKYEIYFEKFQAHAWEYTKKGYLFLEQWHKEGFDGAPGQTLIRVEPLNQACREMNRKYVLPAGYGITNMLSTDWNEGNYGNLDFYDLYEVTYRMKYAEPVPYEENFAGAEYEVPEEDFEEVIQTYFPINKKEIRKHACYRQDGKTYRYRPRGLYDTVFPYEPRPEVVDYKEQKDGTLKLMVEAVWERGRSDQIMSSELIVRPLDNGGFRYVSNRVTKMKAPDGPAWYTKRLSEKEWDSLYGKEKKDNYQ